MDRIPDRGKQLLAVQMKQAELMLLDYLDRYGVNLRTLETVAESFAMSVLELPTEAQCAKGCAWCCHLRVMVSIPELLVIHQKIIKNFPAEVTADLKDRILDADKTGNVRHEDLWYQHQLSCPFLDAQMDCRIYPFRPFTCRVYHSIDKVACRKDNEF